MFDEVGFKLYIALVNTFYKMFMICNIRRRRFETHVVFQALVCMFALQHA